MNNEKSMLVTTAENMNVPEEDYESAKTLLAGGDVSRTAIELMRKNVEERKKAVSVLVEENQINSSARLAQSIADIDGVLLDAEVIQAVREGIINSKDPAKSYSDFAKAANELSKRLKNQLDSEFTADGLLTGGKKGQKIQLAFGDGKLALKVDMGGSTDER